jgi:hypothetical protein
MKHCHLTATGRGHRRGCLPLFWAMAVFTFFVSGCATTGESPLPTVELSSSASAPVGGIIPVFIKRHCTANCGVTSTPLSRQQVAALSDSGEYVQAMPVDDAVKLAGGTHKLLDAINAGESSSSTIARESTFQFQNTSQGIFAIFAVPFAMIGGTSLASQPTETIENLRLNEVTIPDCGPTGCPAGASLYSLHHDPAIGGDQGWVFFPIGKYTRVKASYVWSPTFSAQKDETEILIAPWNGSSTSPSSAPSTSAAAQ